MHIILYIIIFFTYVNAKTVETFTTKARHVYASWSTCDNCTCHHYNIGAFEASSTNPSDIPLPFYLYYSYDSYNECTLTYITDNFYNTDPSVDLDILRSARYAELTTPNMTSHNGNIISLNFEFDARCTESHSCNCKEINIQGIETLKINSKTNYRMAIFSGNIVINGVTQNVADDAYAEIYSSGVKTIKITRN